MHKVGALFHNEMLKIVKKVSVYVLAIIMTVGVIGCSAVIKISDSIGSQWTGSIDNREDSYSYYIEQENVINQQIKNYEDQLNNPSITEGERRVAENELLNLRSNIIYYNTYGSYAKEHGATPLSYKYELLSKIENIKAEMFTIENFEQSDTQTSETYQHDKQLLEEYDKIMKADSYSEYIKWYNEAIQKDLTLTDAQKEAQIEYNNTISKVCPTGVFETADEMRNAQNLLNQKTNISASLNNSVDMELGGNLTAERRTALERDLKLINAKIEKGFLQSDPDNETYGNSFTMAVSLGTFVTAVVLILLAGSMMSHETSTGTIKSLIIAPVKRWKIYLAKYLSLLFTMLVFIFITFILSLVTNGLLFGFGEFGSKVVLFAGRAISMNYFIYQLLMILFSTIPLIIVASFGYMLSIVTKNTAVSVSLSMGIYFGGSVIHMLLLTMLSKYEYLVKYLPFSNFSLFDRVFYSGTSTNNLFSMMGVTSPEKSIPLVFSIVYIIIVLICMIYVGLDSFNRKDIK